MNDFTSITITTTALFVRGDYVTLGSGGGFRLTETSNTTMTIRPAYRWRWAEAVVSRWEDCIWWPFRDLVARVKGWVKAQVAP